MTAVCVREAALSDYERVLQLMRQLNPADSDVSDLLADVYSEILQAPHLKLLIADNGQVVVGSCYLNIIANLTRGGRPYALIENVVTDVGYRQQGVGKRLIGTAIDLAWEAECYKVMLLSGRKEGGVQAFYRSCGFDSEEKQAYIMRSPASVT